MDSLVVEHDIWRPDLGGGRAHLLNAAELVWIPAQQDVVPALQHTHVHIVHVHVDYMYMYHLYDQKILQLVTA